MFGCIFIKPNSPIVNPTILRVSGAQDPLDENIGPNKYTHINGQYNKVHDGFFYYNVTQEPSYDPEGELDFFDYSFVIMSYTFKQFIDDITMNDNSIIKKVYINDVETSLTGNDVVCFLRETHQWEGPIPFHSMLYYNLNNITGTYTKNNLKIVYSIIGESEEYEYEVDTSDSYFTEIFGKTFDQLPDTVTITAIQ